MEDECHDSRGIAVTFCLQGRTVSSLPGPDERRQAEASICLLFTECFIDNGFLLRAGQEPRQPGRCPQQYHTIDQILRLALPYKILAEQLEAVLYFRGRAIVAGRNAYGDGRERGSVILRITLPWRVVKLKPGPRSFGFSRFQLLCPHILKCQNRVGAQTTLRHVI